jgi:gluconokinase
MGVVGVGKTTVGCLLADKLGWQFADGDDFHSTRSIEKISRGLPLDDEDRAPWLARLHNAIVEWNAQNQNVVLACSALKRKYRDGLSLEGVRFVYLEGAPELIRQRLGARHGHFATDSILASQFRDLEVPEDAIAVSVDKTPEAIAEEILTRLKGSGLGYSGAAHP